MYVCVWPDAVCVGRNLAGELELLLPAGGGARKISGDPDPDPMSRSYAEAVSFTKIDHWSILVKEMRAMGAMLVKMAVLPR